MKIIYGKDRTSYFDMNGAEIHEGDRIVLDGKERTVYLTEENELGVDATNPSWIERGLAAPCEFGVYVFCEDDEPVLVS